jgi:hypothetical protein
MRFHSLSLLLCAMAALPVMAQTDKKTAFEAYKARKQQEFAAYKNKKQQEFDAYRRQKNAEFAEYVRKRWEAFDGKKAKPRPKDEDRPPVVVKEEPKPIRDHQLTIKETVRPPKPDVPPKPVAPIQAVPQPAAQWASFAVFGTDMKVRWDSSQKFRLSTVSEAAVADCWKRLSGEAYDNTVHDCLALRSEKGLSDWAYLSMLQQMAERCLGRGNEATLLVAYVFSQSGYKMRLALAGSSLRMLYASKHSIYGKPYFTVGGEEYYVWNGSEQSLHICQIGFPKEKPLSLYVPTTQKLAARPTQQRTLTSKRYPDMQLAVSVNKNLIDFYSSYPTSSVGGNFMTRWAMYANTPMEPTAKKTLYPALHNKIKGLSEKEAVERMLNWVQTAFTYEYDDKVWGHDRAFFAEESLFYPYCDCEDRSILLSRLVRDLLGLKCILIYYPGHLAMAVQFAGDVKGDYILLGGQRYVVCDPTYIGAPVGATMPGMDNSRATVVLLD